MSLSALLVVIFIDQILMQESLTLTLNNKKVKTFSKTILKNNLQYGFNKTLIKINGNNNNSEGKEKLRYNSFSFIKGLSDYIKKILLDYKIDCLNCDRTYYK